MARNRLKIAEKFKSNKEYELFYDEVSKALWGYLSYKFNIPYAELSKDTINQTFSSKNNITEELSQQFVNVLNECEFARFAPGDKVDTMDKVYNEALDVIIKLEKALK
ncbi:MAG: hypothetical protein BWY70_00731 [Bacteroidetes bacterium ADurb.Bin408]|nr:MAG: hypothetical protein BWY70_00731 [Bacteroidetes bacterium ADurb.Bin408]